MFVLANLLDAVAQILDWGVNIYVWIIIARSIISWVNPDPYNPIVRFLYTVTEPLLYRIRRFLPAMGGFDLSPIIAIFAIYFVKWFIVKTLVDAAIRIRMGGGI